MNNKYLVYSIVVTFLCSLGSWSGLAHRAAGGQGSGNSWHPSAGAGYGGGFASAGGGGHK